MPVRRRNDDDRCNSDVCEKALTTIDLLFIAAKKKGDLMSKDERTETDKKRSRRRKKLKQRLKQKEIQKREEYLQKTNPGKRNKHSREKIQKELENLTKNFSVTSVSSC